MFSILNLLNKYYWKSIFGPCFSFILPPIFVLILGTILDPKEMMPGIITMCSIITGLTCLPQAVYEFKKSVLLKRIGVTTIKPHQFLAIVCFFYFIMMMFSVGTTLGIAMLIYIHSWNDIFRSVDYGAFLLTQIFSVILSISLGITISSIFNNLMAIQAVGILLAIVSLFLSGTAISPLVIQQKNLMVYLSYILPFKFTTELSIEAWNSNIGWMQDPGNIASWQHAIQQIDSVKSFNSNVITTLNTKGDWMILPFNPYGAHTADGTMWLYNIHSQVIFNVSGYTPVIDPTTHIVTIDFSGATIKDGSVHAANNINGSSIWNFKDFEVYRPFYHADKTIVEFNSIDKKLDWGLPFIYMIVLFTLSSRSFQWQTRGN